MLRISPTTKEIHITYLDYDQLKITVKNGLTGEDYELEESEYLTLSINNKPNNRNPLRVLTADSDNIFTFKEEDTADLPLTGNLYYGVELRDRNIPDRVHTVIEWKPFVIGKLAGT